MVLLTRPPRRRGCLGCLFWSAPVALLSLVALLFVAAELLRFAVAVLVSPYAPSPWRLALSLAILAAIQIAPRAWRSWRNRQFAAQESSSEA